MSILNQARTGFGMSIKANSSIAYRWIYPFKDNGLGVMIRDLDATPTIIMEAVRLVLNNSGVSGNSVYPSGLDSAVQFYVDAFHDSDVAENETIIINGVGYKAGVIDKLSIAGGLFGIRFPVAKVSISSDCEIIGANIDNGIGVVGSDSVLFELPIGTDVTALEPIFNISGVSISPTGLHDFSEPVEYIVTAKNIGIKKYMVEVVLV